MQKDYETQRKAKSLEYVDVNSCKKLQPASKSYLDEFNKMSEKERFRMFEINHYDSDTDKDTINNKNHFLLYTTDGLSEVVHENWFEIEQDEW